MQTPTPKIAHALHELAQSPALRELESRIAAQNAFNLFDAIGVSNQELRHSDFLAFLLRPNEAHGLGDAFLKWFIGHALAASPAPPVSRDTLNAWDLTDAHVEREGEYIDISIISAQNRLAVIVENKIHTGEHSDQLARYKAAAEAHGYGGQDRTLLCVYLTPRGSKPTHADYLPIGYEAICARLETLCRSGAFARAASPDVETVVRHYTRMLRSQKIVGDPDISKLCRELYATHQAAFDRVFAELQNKEEQNTATISVDSIVGNTPGFVWLQRMNYKDTKYSFFIPASWANETGLRQTTKGIKHLRCFYLQVETHLNGYQEISGILTPCIPAVRQKLVTLVNKSESFSFVPHPAANEPFRCFYRYRFVESFSSQSAGINFAVAWQNWFEYEGPKLAALIQPGDFPAVENV